MKLLILILLTSSCATKFDKKLYYEGIASGAKIGCQSALIDNTPEDQDIDFKQCEKMYWDWKKEGK